MSMGGLFRRLLYAVGGSHTVQPTSPINNPPYLMVYDESATNLIANPSFEVNVTDGWNLQGSNSTKTRVTSEKYSGDASMQVVVSPATASSGVVTTSIPVSSNTRYILSFFVKGAAGSEPFGVQYVGNVSGAAAVGTFTLTTSWVRQAISYVTGASDTSITLRFMTNAVVAATWYMDAIQLEQQPLLNTYPVPTSYLDGSLGVGYSWAGTPHNSASSRTAGLQINAPVADGVSNPFVVRPDGSTVAYQKIEQCEGALASGGGVSDPKPFFYWKGSILTVSQIGALDSLARFENTNNGVSLWVKSNATSESSLLVEGPNITTGAILSVAAPSSLASMTGSFLRFFDKSNKDMFTVKRDTMTYGNAALGWTKSFIKYSGGAVSETSGANLTGTVAWSGTTLTGTLSSFTTELAVGSVVSFTGSTQLAIIEAIASNTSATTTAAASPAISAGTAYQVKPAQVGVQRTFIEGPSGDHVGSQRADVTSCFFLTDADQMRLRQTSFTSGNGNITLTAGSGSVTTSSANAGLAVGDWIHVQGNSVSALGNEPLRVIRVVSTTSFMVAPVATTSQAAVAGWTYQKANQLTAPTANSDGFGVVLNNFRDFTAAGPSATTNETSIFSTLFRIRGGTISVNRMIRITAQGTLSGANAGKTLTLRVKLGTTTILTTHAEVIADTSTNNWWLDVVICSVNSLSSQTTALKFHCQSPTTSVVDHILDVETSTVNMGADQDLDITAQWGVAASTLSSTYKIVEVV